MKIYDKWVNKNCPRLDNKIVVVTGADGSIGYYICYYLLVLGAKIVMVVKDMNQGNACKDKLLQKFPKASISIEYIDLFDLDSIYAVLPKLNKYNPDYLINNAGVYHLPIKHNKEGLERTFCVNFYGPHLLTEGLIETISKNGGKIVSQCSVSVRWIRSFDFDDLNLDKTKNLTQKYGKTKVMMMLDSMRLKRKGVNIDLSHPGASATSLFASKRGGFTKAFNALIVPLMKFIFISPSKASLPTIYTLTHTLKYGEWVGPRGMFNIWGYPGVQKVNSKFLDNRGQDLLNEKVEQLIKKEGKHD